MQKAKELLNRGELTAAIERMTQVVKSQPADIPSRVFLFELLCLAGDLDRAEKQLEVVGHQSTQMQLGVEVYHGAVAAERARRAVFRDGGAPNFLTAPPAYAALHLEAITLLKQQEPAKARAVLEKSLALEPALAGQADGQRFEEFGDSDIFLGPFLELIVNEKYAWLPFEQIKRIEISRPEQLRDLFWARAKLEAKGGDLGTVLLPVLYPGSSENANDAVKLGRLTDWLDVGEGLARGSGQRLFLVDGQERAMLEIAEINFETGSVETTA